MIKLNLGCGPQDIRPDYVNIDIVDYPGVDKVADARNLSFYENDSVEYIVAQHLLEYIPRKDMSSTLREWHRVLKQDSHLEIRVTDIATIFKSAFHNSISGEMGIPVEMVLSLLYGKQENENDIKLNGFSATYLQGVLSVLGFSCTNMVYENYDIILSAKKL